MRSFGSMPGRTTGRQDERLKACGDEDRENRCINSKYPKENGTEIGKRQRQRQRRWQTLTSVKDARAEGQVLKKLSSREMSHRETVKERQRDRQTDRQADSKTVSHTYVCVYVKSFKKAISGST